MSGNKFNKKNIAANDPNCLAVVRNSHWYNEADDLGGVWNIDIII